MPKVTFTMPDNVLEGLKKNVSLNKRSAFVAAAVAEKIRKVEREALEMELERAYKETYEEDKAINAEWEFATLENWPD